MHNAVIGVTKQLIQRTSNVVIETLVLQPSKFHKKNNTQGVDKLCEAMHFK